MKNLEKLAELAKSLPAPLNTNASALVEKMGEVLEGFGDKPIEWRPDNLKLVQATSDRSKLPKSAVIGSLLLGEELVSQPFKVIPLRMDKTRQHWNPDNTKAQVICSSPDAKTGFLYGDCYSCPHSKFDEVANRSACNTSLSYLCINAELTSIFMVNFSKTNYVNGTDWKKSMEKLRLNPYHRYYNLTTETSPKAKNVEILKAAGIPGEGKVGGPVLAFVTELFLWAKQTRIESLENFYHYVEMKKGNSQLQIGNTTGSEVVMLTDDSEVLPPEEVAAEVKTGTGRKNYSM